MLIRMVGLMLLVAAAGMMGVRSAGVPGASSAEEHSEPVSPMPEAAAPFTVDRVHSTLIYRIRHFGVSYFFGRINLPSGTFAIDDEDLEGSHIHIAVEIRHMDAGNETRDRFLLGPDFFNAREHPTAEFRSSKITQVDDGRYEAQGEFTMRGVTRPITVAVNEYTTRQTDRFGYRAGFLCTFDIKRSEFGMDRMIDDLTLGDEVQITVSIEGVVEQ